MTSYLLAYDLRKKETADDYKPLRDELKRWGAQKTQYSVWLVASSGTATDVHDHFKNLLDKDDRLWVAEIVFNHDFINAIGGTNEWLRRNPPDR